MRGRGREFEGRFHTRVIMADDLKGSTVDLKHSVSFDNGLPVRYTHEDVPEVIINPEAPKLVTPGRTVKLDWVELSVTATEGGPNVLTRIKNALCKTSGGIKNVAIKKQILFDVTADARPGSMLAIMGASGAGKTTLLNVLARQATQGLHIEGEILVNGRDVGSDMRSISAYVRQEDLFYGTLTVKEHLRFQALLRMDEKYTQVEKLKRVQEVMDELSLNKCKDTVIGVPGRIKGISGGEMKRLSLASEILNHPSLLFADEPTSGLDSFMAESVCSALRNIASQGKTVVATIHQPASDTFHLFDRLLLMSEGRIAYLGPTTEALAFFNKAGYQCPSNYNPADHYIYTLAIVPGKEAESKAKAKGICDFYESELVARKQAALTRRQSSVIPIDQDQPQKYKSGWIDQLLTITHRSSIATWREPFMVKSRFFENVMIALIAGLVFLRQDYDLAGIQNINGALFFCIIILSFNTVMGSVFTFPVEIAVFQKEHKLRMYRTDTYYLGKNIAELPWSIIFPSIFSVITYFMIGFHETAASFFIFLGYILMVVQCAVSFAYFVACISPSVQVANGLAPAMIMPFLLFGGFFLKDESIPDYFIWLKWVSWFKYSFELLLVNQWRDVTFKGVVCNGTVGTCFQNGLQVIADKGYDEGNVGRNIGIMFALIIAWRIMAFLVLLGRARK